MPGLLLRDKLLQMGYNVEIELVETLYSELTINKLRETKRQFHLNNRVAVKAHQIPQKMIDTINEDKKQNIFIKWRNEDRRRFIIISGFWVDIVKEYCQLRKDIVCLIDCIHLDSVLSNSWKCCREIPYDFNQIWPFSFSDKKLNCKFDLLLYELQPFAERTNSILCHGGGWGMGTYLERLLSMPFIPKSIIYYYKDKIEPSSNILSSYYLDEDWQPWDIKNGRHTYPQMHYIDNKCNKQEFITKHQHKLFDIALSSKAILSKPGGATLLDSIESETPLIFVAPVGRYEKENAALWVELGFGYYLDDFLKNNLDYGLLEKANIKLKRHKDKLKGVDQFLCSLKQM